MKIIISEAQLDELKAKSEKYLNQLLDRISKYGMESLGDDEKEALMKMSRNEDPEMDIKAIVKFWKTLFQQKFKMDVDNETWLITLIDTIPGITLHVVNPSDGFTFYIILFANYEPIIRIKIGEEDFDAPIEENEIPRTKREIDNFHYVFRKSNIPDAIKIINSNFRNK